MANKKRTPELYKKLADAYREKPGNYAHAALRANMQTSTAKLAWEVGWPELSLPPIKELLQTEGVYVRERLLVADEAYDLFLKDPEVRHRITTLVLEEAHREAKKEIEKGSHSLHTARERAREDRVKVRAEEAEFARYLRGRAKIALAQSTPVFNGLQEIGPALEKRLKKMRTDADKDINSLDPQEVLKLMHSNADYLLKVANLAQVAITIERKAAGEPDVIVGHQEMTYEEALQLLQEADETSKRAKPFSLITGGKE